MPRSQEVSAVPCVEEETLLERFRRLERIWQRETGVLSSPPRLINHPAFQEILSLGMAVVPFMLRDLEERPRLWVWALPMITGEQPVMDPADAGDIERQSKIWLRWAKEKGLRW